MFVEQFPVGGTYGVYLYILLLKIKIRFFAGKTYLEHLKLDTMSWGRKMDSCGRFVKYSLFIVNLIMSVSCKQFRDMYLFLTSNHFSDWRISGVKFRYMDYCRQILCQWTSWNESLFRSGVCVNCHWTISVIYFLFWLLWFHQRN